MEKDPSIDAVGNYAVAALQALALEDLPLRDRIRKAWVDHLLLVDYERLSPPFKKRYDHMLQLLDGGDFISETVESFSDEEAEHLARRIVDFALDLQLMVGAWMR